MVWRRPEKNPSTIDYIDWIEGTDQENDQKQDGKIRLMGATEGGTQWKVLEQTELTCNYEKQYTKLRGAILPRK